METVLYLYIFIVGTVIGSFLNCAIYRLPLKKSLVTPGSYCTSCNTPIKWYNNIPLFSWFILRGKCASCSASYSFRYPFVEFLFGILLLLIFKHFGGFTLDFFLYAIFCASLTAIFFIDFDHQIIPDVINYPLLFVGLFTAWFVHNDFFDGLLGGLAGFTFFLLLVILTKGKGMGMGDVKMIAMLGTWFGLMGVFFLIMISSVMGSVIGLIMMSFGKAGMKTALPFGTFMAVAGVLMIFFGDFLRETYILFYQ
ncbi:MAG: prepilin peptidase [Nitrospinae bacterium]|nr:prepilin peptidase [Nitrospinota bacterium]